MATAPKKKPASNKKAPPKKAPATKPLARKDAPAKNDSAAGIGPRLLDARPDRLDLRDLPYRPPLRSLPPVMPSPQDVQAYLGAYVKAGLIRNQGNQGACTGFGLACVANYLLWTRHLELGVKAPFDSVSPRMFYSGEGNGEVEPTAAGERFIAVKTALTRLLTSLEVVKQPPPEIEAMVRRLEQLRFDLDFIVVGEEESFVYWGERRGRGVFLQATPIDASGILNDRLFSRTETDSEYRQGQ